MTHSCCASCRSASALPGPLVGNELCSCPRLSFLSSVCLTCFAFSDASPRHRIQNISRFVWKQANVASELWEKLTARCVDQHRHIERTLEQLLEIKGAMEELSTALDQAENVRETWEPIGDLFIDSLPEHIQSTKVLAALRRSQLQSAGGVGSSQLTPAWSRGATSGY